MKKYLLSVLALLLMLGACIPSTLPGTDLFSLLTSQGGRWRVVKAMFGDEEATPDMYDEYEIRFNANGTYSILNPRGAVSITARNNGSFVVSDGRNVIFDGNVRAREISTNLNRSRIILEFDVTIPGKMTTTYRFELAPR